MNVRGIRGAITVNKNDKDEILFASKLMIEKIMEKNALNKENLISITFTATKDLDAVYPAKAVRDLGYTNIPLMCLQEMNVEESLSMCIRVLVLCETEKSHSEINHIYLRDAQSLRPDWVQEE